MEQFPEYAKSVLEIVGIYKEELDEMVASNNQSIQSVYDGYKFILEKIACELEQPELSFEEKERINQRLFDIANKMAEVDEKNKSWILQMVTRVGGTLCVAGGVLLLALGGNVQMNRYPDEDEYLDDDSSHDQYLS